jgi:demethylmenaquinone methyltransferase/2-methoxy-6-polyprenyl-1,4-benzoquinol methylase
MGKRDILITGLEARLYDVLVLAGTAGLYQALITRAVHDLGIRPQDRILDMGSGTGKNAVLMSRHLDGGSITGLDISPQMLRKLHRKAARNPRIRPLELSIDGGLPFREEFDKVVLFFVLHGFPQPCRERILKNALRALKPGGTVHLLDWNRMDLARRGPLLRLFFRYVECDQASDFITRDAGAMLRAAGFENLHGTLYARGLLRMLAGARASGEPAPRTARPAPSARR